MICDTTTDGDVWKIQVYIGRKTGAAREVKQSERVVKIPVPEIENSERNVIRISMGRKIHSTWFEFRDNVTIASYCPKKNKTVSTYNETKAGVDKAGQMLRNYSV